MPAPSGSAVAAGGVTSRLPARGLVLPASPARLGTDVESGEAGHPLFLSGMLPVVHRALAVAGRLGDTLPVFEIAP